jgi:hypothetical protein
MALGVTGFHLIGSFALHNTKYFVSWTPINESMLVTNLSKQRAAGKHTIKQQDINDTEMQTRSKLSKFVMSTRSHMRFFMQQPNGSRCR